MGSMAWPQFSHAVQTKNRPALLGPYFDGAGPALNMSDGSDFGVTLCGRVVGPPPQLPNLRKSGV
jgi:hypothetical protein